jgi:tetratricopeptide (TPR) repeat protein
MVVSGKRPTRPADASDLGISDPIWRLLTDCWSADRQGRPDVVQVWNMVQEAVPTWAPPPASGFSKDVGDDESELDWTVADDTVKAPLGEGAQDSRSDVSIINIYFENYSNIVQDTDAISATISQAEEPLIQVKKLPIVSATTNGIDTPPVDTGTPRNTRTATKTTSFASNSGITPHSASGSNKVNDEETEIKYWREYLNRHPPGHSERRISLHGLAMALLERFRRTGRMGDLEESIQLHRQSLELHPSGHPERHTSLHGLGAALLDRFRRTGAIEDLEESIWLHRRSLELRPLGHPQHDTSLYGLGATLLVRFRRSGGIEDLEESIQLDRQCLELRPSGHPERHNSLNELGVALLDHFERTGGMEDLEESIRLHRQSLELRPLGHPEHRDSLNSLGLALGRRFETNGQLRDINEAIQLHCASVETSTTAASGSNDPQSTSLQFLRWSLEVRFKKTGERCDTDEAMKLYRASLRAGRSGQSQTSAPPLDSGVVSRMRRLVLGGRSAER